MLSFHAHLDKNDIKNYIALDIEKSQKIMKENNVGLRYLLKN